MAQAGEVKEPTRLSTTVFWCKSTLLKIRRVAQDVSGRAQRYLTDAKHEYPFIAAESRTPLWSEDSQAERSLQIGKVQNLRCALRNLNGATIPAGGIFSFWKQIGRATPRRGYVRGRQLREGCLYPAVGGGLCQLSNALYDLALKSGCEIVERHPHTSIVPGSAAEVGRDATVAWNYIDLRFRPSAPLRIEAFLTRDELVVRFCASEAPVAETSRVYSAHIGG
jgi:vancomycin resistance protein YoaR